MKSLVFLAFLLSIQGASVEDPAGEREQADENQTRIIEIPPVVVTVDGPLRLDGPIEIQDRTEQDEESFWEKYFPPESIPNWFLLIIAGLATWLAARNLKYLRRQTTQMRIQGRHMMAQTRTMKSELLESRNQFAMSNRAYLKLTWSGYWPDAPMESALYGGNVEALFVLEIENSGHTSAAIRSVEIFFPSKSRKILGAQVIPGESVKHTFRHAFPPSQGDTIIVGQIGYFDGFRWWIRHVHYTVMVSNRVEKPDLVDGFAMQGGNNEKPAHLNEDGEVVRDDDP